MEAVLTTSTCVRSLQYADLGSGNPTHESIGRRMGFSYAFWLEMCFKKKKAYFITNNHAVVWRLCAAAGAGGAALLGWAETSPGTAGSTKAVAEVRAHWIARSRETASTAY